MLLHWKHNEEDIISAREKWLNKTTPVKTLIGNFLKKVDRQALGKYLITGELLKGEVGSVVMFSLPDGYSGSLAMDESVFQTINFEALMKSRLNSDNIVNAAINYLRSSIQKLTENILKKHIIIDINFELVNLSKTNVIKKIASLNPYTISWSNVCDYYRAQDFHRMAKMCSGENTLHFAYSMNWPRFVFGTSMLDYLGNDELLKFMNDLIDKFQKDIIPSLYEHLGVKNLLRLPYVGYPRSMVDYILHIRFQNEWTEYFFSKSISGIMNKDNQVKEEISICNFFSFSSSTLFFVFSYDPEMKLVVQ